MNSLLDPRNEKSIHGMENFLEPAPQKFKEQTLTKKVTVTMFWDTEGMITIEYLLNRSTITADSYFDTLIRLEMVIKKKRSKKLNRKILLLHDNARSHSASLPQILLIDFK